MQGKVYRQISNILFKTIINIAGFKIIVKIVLTEKLQKGFGNISFSMKQTVVVIV